MSVQCVAAGGLIMLGFQLLVCGALGVALWTWRNRSRRRAYR